MPTSRVFRFTDPDRYQAAIRAANIELFPTARGDFHAELVQIDLHRVWMQRGSENLPTASHGAVTAERAVIEFLTDADQPSYQRNGVGVTPGKIVVDDRRSAHRRCSSPHRWGSVSLPPADLAAAGRTLCGRELAIPSVTRLVQPPAEVMNRLLSLHHAAAEFAKSAPEIIAHSEVARSLEQGLVRVMIQCLSESSGEEERAGFRQRSAVMARFKDFLAAPCAEIFAAAGVSARRLRACCQEQLGMGPVHYLWLRRILRGEHCCTQTQPNRSRSWL
jgi:hypothetical protein